MGRFFNEAIREDIFLKFKERFCHQLSFVASLHLFDDDYSSESEKSEAEINEVNTLDFDIPFTEKSSRQPEIIFTSNEMLRRLDSEFKQIEIELMEKISVFTKSEKLLYLLKLINDASIEKNATEKYSYFNNDYQEFKELELQIIINNFYIQEIQDKELFRYYLKYISENRKFEEDVNNFYVFDFLSNENDEFEFNYVKKFVPFFNESSKYYYNLVDKIHDLVTSIYKNYYEGNLTEENRIEVLERVVNENRPIFVLPDHYDLSKLNQTQKGEKERKFKFTELNKFEITILFEYLCECGVFIAFDYTSKARIASFLTASSEKTLRTEGFPYIEEILSGKIQSKSGKTTNNHKEPLIKVRDLLQSIIDKINNRLKE